MELIIDILFKIKDEYKLELKTPETTKLFGSTKKTVGKIKNGENVPSLEVVEVGLIQCNIVEHQYQQKSDVLCNFTPNKSCAYLLNVEPRSLVFLRTYCDIELDKIIITFIDQNASTAQISVFEDLL